jgi:hypothetical protein
MFGLKDSDVTEYKLCPKMMSLPVASRFPSVGMNFGSFL